MRHAANTLKGRNLTFDIFSQGEPDDFEVFVRAYQDRVNEEIKCAFHAMLLLKCYSPAQNVLTRFGQGAKTRTHKPVVSSYVAVECVAL